MIVFRRRLIFWLIKAYVKKSKKTLMFSFLFGLIIFFFLAFGSRYVNKIFPLAKKSTIGVVGVYRQDNLPPLVVGHLSRGLTSVAEDGSIKPDLASSWEVADKGKTYIFHLKKNNFFRDGKEVTSDSVLYNFSDVKIEKPDKYTLVFKIKDAYSPFLVTVSRPIFKKGFVGVGSYQIENVKLNGEFVQSLTIASAKDKFDRKNFLFYPTEEALKTAFLLGEISQASGIGGNNLKDIPFDKFPNIRVQKSSNYSRLVTLFFDTTDSSLSDEKLRLALDYALPDTFVGGDRAYLPYSPKSIYYNTDIQEKEQDFEHAKLLLSSSNTASDSAQIPSFTIKTLRKYKPTAESIAAAWKHIGVKTSIEEVDGIPNKFQIFLGDFNLAKDPDQYTLWHSEQPNNITKYKNLRIDLLLEEGRKKVNIDERKQIYADFQKYLADDVPAIFLYFPIEYSAVRK
jgi:peptide/nickel transport system substrate-binding protein